MLLQDVDLSRIMPQGNGLLRSGIIPYVKRNGDIYFLMGVDTDSHDMSDFGGGCKSDENALSCALRELREESRGILEFQDIKTIRYAIFHKKTKQNVCIMFAEVKKPYFFENARRDFHKRILPYNEMCDVVWLSSEEILKQSRLYYRNSRIWSRIRYVLSKCGSFNRRFIERLYYS